MEQIMILMNLHIKHLQYMIESLSIPANASRYDMTFAMLNVFQSQQTMLNTYIFLYVLASCKRVTSPHYIQHTRKVTYTIYSRLLPCVFIRNLGVKYNLALKIGTFYHQ